MQSLRLKKGFVGITYGNRTLYISRNVILAVTSIIVVVLLCILSAFFTMAKSAHELETLKQQLTVERAVNESLSREIHKSRDGIEKIINSLSNEPKRKKATIHVPIASPVQLYGVLKDIQSNLNVVDDMLNQKIKNVRTIISLTKIRNNNIITQGLGKLNIAESISANLHSNSIQKASKTFDAFSNLSISNSIETILLKKEGLNVLQKTLSKMPIEKPISNGRFVSGFGKRFHPIHHMSLMHKGIDFVGSKNAKVLSTGDGIVEKATYSKSFGNFIVIRHPHNITTLYAHMKELKVRPGQKVSVGQAIGVQGTTGTSTGDHVHYEITVNGEHRDPLNFIRTKAILQNV